MSRWKKILIAAFVSILFVFFFPGSYKDRDLDQVCVSNCQKNNSTKSDLRLDDCAFPVPIDGFSVSCIGVSRQGACTKSASCLSWCTNTCYGIVTGTGAAPNPIESKLNFVKKYFYFSN